MDFFPKLNLICLFEKITPVAKNFDISSEIVLLATLECTMFTLGEKIQSQFRIISFSKIFFLLTKIHLHQVLLHIEAKTEQSFLSSRFFWPGLHAAILNHSKNWRGMRDSGPERNQRRWHSGQKYFSHAAMECWACPLSGIAE